MSERPIRQTTRQLTSEPPTRLAALFDKLAGAIACLCGPARPPNPLVHLYEHNIPDSDSEPLYE